MILSYLNMAKLELRDRILILLATVFFALFMIVFFFRLAPTDCGELPLASCFNYTSFSDWYTVIMSFLAGIALLVAGFFYGLKTKQGQIWLALGLGYVLWSFGDILWTLYELVWEIDPYPSWADFAYFLGFIPLFYALVRELRILGLPKLDAKFVIFLTAFITYAAIASFTVVVPIYEEVEISLLEKIVSIGTPVLDSVLIFLVGLVFIRLSGGRLSIPWVAILSSQFAIAVADTWFSYLNWFEYYGDYHYVDLLWIVGYYLGILAGILTIAIVRSPEKPNEQLIEDSP